MTTSTPPQIRLANDIAAQFPHVPAEEAAERIATHIRLFWDPRMREDLLRLARTESDTLDPRALAATELL